MDDIPNGLTPTADQHFLLYFIMGTYFAPDVKEENPHKSVLQRRAEGLPPYALDQLAGSHIRTVEVEKVYYYVLRKADDSVVVKLPWLYQFFHGNLPSPAEDPAAAYPQFNDLFPLKLHPLSRLRNQYDVFENLVFINNPEISYIKPEDIERFKRLTGLQDFFLYRDDATVHRFGSSEILKNMTLQGEINSENLHQSYVQPVSCSGAALDANGPSNTLPFTDHFHGATPKYNCTMPLAAKTSVTDDNEPRMIFLPCCPSSEDWINIVAGTKGGTFMTGTAAVGQVGPVLGRIDIGECDDSYLFRVSLPGVKRDEREFSCEVENNGKVLIRGVTAAGETTVHRYSQVFKMQSQNLSPSGHFSISFKLPGPVDPHQFSGNFGTDGILEGIVMKVE